MNQYIRQHTLSVSLVSPNTLTTEMIHGVVVVVVIYVCFIRYRNGIQQTVV